MGAVLSLFSSADRQQLEPNLAWCHHVLPVNNMDGKQMSTSFDTAMDAEDAYYDSIDESDLEGMMSVWASSPNIACLLPMHPVHQGREAIRELWKTMLDPELKVDIVVNHLNWIELGDTAIHLLEEVVTLEGDTQLQPPIYATNVYHRDDSGWHLQLHLNSPTPMPAGVLPPIPGTERE